VQITGLGKLNRIEGEEGNQVDGINSADLIKYMARRLSNRYPKKDILVQIQNFFEFIHGK
jgi:hypothetical protein